MARLTARHGVLVVDKPPGPSSHAVVAEARRLFGMRGIGHAGTLDPAATGVLLLLLGEATKLSGYLTLDDKRYRATVAFGRSTDTLDAAGRVTEEHRLDPGWLDPASLQRAIRGERERTEQLPPAFSAIRLGGQRAYRASRKGCPPPLTPRPVEVRRLELLSTRDDSADFELLVSKGYYVRAFARDLGQRLGVPAHLSALRRLASGPFRLEEAAAWPPPESPLSPLSLEAVVERTLPVAELREEGARRARYGQRLGPEDFSSPPETTGSVAAWLGPDRRLVALGRGHSDGTYAVARGFDPGAE